MKLTRDTTADEVVQASDLKFNRTIEVEYRSLIEVLAENLRLQEQVTALQAERSDQLRLARMCAIEFAADECAGAGLLDMANYLRVLASKT